MPLPFSNADEAILWMEALCRSFQVDPKTAEKALLDLRTAEGAIEASKAIFERSSMPMAQFHAVCTLQAAGLIHWEDLSDSDRHGLRAFIWDVLARRRDALDDTAAAQALRTFCVFWKRSWADEPEPQRRAVLAHLAELAASDNPESALLAAKTARALVLEFGVSQASSLGLPLEYHRRARRAFEEIGLDECLALGMDLLGRVTAAAAAGGRGGGGGSSDAAAAGLEPALLPPASAAVKLVTDLLSWEFNEREAWQMPRSDELVCPGPRWREYLVRPAFLSSVFNLYERVRNGLPVASGGGVVSGTAGRDRAVASAMASMLPHDVRQLLIQLASVHGDIFANAAQKSAFASFLLEGATAILAAPLRNNRGHELSDGANNGGISRNGDTLLAGAESGEARDMTTMAARLLSNFQLAAVRSLPCFESFVRGLASLTAMVLAGAAADAAIVAHGGESWRHECLGVLLEAWGYIVEDRSVQTGEDSQLRAALSELTRPLYDRYVAARIALARAEAATTSDEENSEEEYIESSDLKEQMSAAATLGRISAAASLGLLTSRLEAASRELAAMVQTGAVGGRPALLPPLAPPAPGALMTSVMTSEFAREDHVSAPEPRLSPEACALLGEARVVVLLAGHLMADEDAGEASLVPEALQCGLAQEPQAVESLLRLTGLLMDFLRFESGRLATSAAGADDPTLSPYLADGLLWCLTRWARTYLLPNTHLYLQGGLGLHPQLLAAFGHGSDTGGGGSSGGADAAAGSGGGVADPWAMNGGGRMNGGGSSHIVNGIGGGSGGAAAAGGPAAAMVATLLDAAWLYLCRWHGQPDVVSNALALLDVLASQQVAPTAWAERRMAEIVAAHGRPAPARPPRGATGAALGLWAGPEGFRRLPTDARKILASCLLKCALHSASRNDNDVRGGGGGGQQAAEMAAAAVAAPVRDRFARLVAVSEQMRPAQRQALEVVEEAVLCVALCRGIARASMEGAAGYGGGGNDGNSGLHVGQEFVDPLLEGMVRLLRMNVAGEDAMVGEILAFLKDVSEVQLPSMSVGRALRLYDACGAALRIYAEHHWGRHRGHDPSAEEDAYSDVLCVLQLLGLLVEKDFVDFSEDEQQQSHGSPEGERMRQAVPEVAFFGLSRVLPLMTEGLLQFPALAEHYLSLVGFVVEEFAERLPSLDFDLFRQLVQSLLFGSQQNLAPVARTSLKALCGVAEWHAAAVTAGAPGLSAHVARWPTLFTDCLGPLLRMLVFEPCVWDRLDGAADAVAALVACERAGFEQMAAQIIAQQPPQAGARLSEAFRVLFSGEAPNPVDAAAGGAAARQNARSQRTSFHAKMREFVTTVRAFMLVA